MKKFYRVSYLFWRAVGSVAIFVFHASQTEAHRAYVKGGKSGRRAKRPLTAVYNKSKEFQLWITNAVKS